MQPNELIRISKYLSKHLRHAPERIGLVLGPGGWVLVNDLLTACARHSVSITRAELEEVVAKSDKQRFAFDETGLKIRANQGHTVEVDLELEPKTPPNRLFHGTPQKNVEPILASGLLKMARHHVHLSEEIATAEKVGARRGKPVILTVHAESMARAGFVFYRSANGVWLVDHVPPAFLSVGEQSVPK